VRQRNANAYYTVRDRVGIEQMVDVHVESVDGEMVRLR
jgi:hypothetical protein